MVIRKVVPALPIVYCLLVVWAGVDLFRNFDDYSRHSGKFQQFLIVLRCLVLVAGGLVAGTLISRWGRRQPAVQSSPGWSEIRILVIAFFIPVVLVYLVSQYLVDELDYIDTKSLYYSLLGICLGLWCGIVLSARQSATSSTAISRVAEVVLFNIAVSVICLELVLNIYSRFFPSPLLWNQSSIESSINAHRQQPGKKYFNSILNSGGYHDAEFFVAGERDFVVAVLGDSFGLGVVPYAYNFTTVAERELRDSLDTRYERVAVHNFGIPAIGMNEYLYLMRSEVMQYRPDVVVVAIFVGNDLIDQKSVKRQHANFRNWMIFQLPLRLLTIARENNSNPEQNVVNIGDPVLDGEDIPDYVLDWRKEKPSMSEAKFLEYERNRLPICDTNDPEIESLYQVFFNQALQFKKMLGDNIHFVLIPDEFQVNDALYERLISEVSNPESYQRDYPQGKITEFFRENEIQYLDLLPALRSAEMRERTYHLHNTHWNAHGNAVAGQKIGDYLRDVEAGRQQ